jgi:hypothetical protein
MELGDFAIRRLSEDDFPTLRPLAEALPADIFAMPSTDTEFRAFVGEVASRVWSLPLVCVRAGDPVGMCFMNVAQFKNLNAYLVALFVQPEEAALPLALYIRHAFWSFPLHRLYVQLPATAAAIPHLETLERVGFQREGTLVAHVKAARGPQDVIVVGLLRDEFERWCKQNEPRLELG